MKTLEYLIFLILFLSSSFLYGQPNNNYRAIKNKIIGGYGFISQFENMPEQMARKKIRDMVQLGVKEFQFYDWFYNYSTPLSSGCWLDPFFHRREVCLKTIKIYIDEIHKNKARAWAYVQAVGSEDIDLDKKVHGVYKLYTANGIWYWHENRFPTYFANDHLAKYIVNLWAPSIKLLKFNGIHWDTLGALAGNYNAEKLGFYAFLKKSKELLLSYNLKQTANFVNFAWWDEYIVQSYVEFPYAEVWSSNKESEYLSFMLKLNNKDFWGVIAFYPTVDKSHNETETSIIFKRFQRSKLHHLHYAIIANGKNRLIREYIPLNRPLTLEEENYFINNKVRINSKHTINYYKKY